MRISLLLFLFVLTTIFTACGIYSEGEDQTSFPETPRSEKTQLAYDLDKEIENFSVTCRDTQGCPEAVGMMVASEKNHAYRCSGFLIEGNVFATSGHCIPKDLRKKGKSCDERVFFLFANKSGKTTRVGCSELKDFNVADDSLYDYAFFKIKGEISREGFKINKDKRVNFQNVTIWKVNPLREREGRIFSTGCKLQQKAIGSEFFDGPRTAVINYSGCSTRKGNSGSAVVNTKGEAIAIHQSSIKRFSKLGRVLSRYIVKDDFFPSGQGTNLGCLAKRGTSYSHKNMDIPKSCEVDFSNAELDQRRNLLLRDAIKRYLSPEIKEKMFRSITSREWGFFKYDVSSGFRILYDQVSNEPKELKLYATIVPDCIRDKMYLLDESFVLRVEHYYQNRSVIIQNSPLCPVAFTLNKRLQIEQMKIDTDMCRYGHIYFDFKRTNLLTRSIVPMVQVWSPISFEDIKTPFSQHHELRLCK
jgi:V8-like Glu-specific endopeptidase